MLSKFVIAISDYSSRACVMRALKRSSLSPRTKFIRSTKFDVTTPPAISLNPLLAVVFLYSSSFKIIFKFLFISFTVVLSSCPSRPNTRSLSMVASFESRIRDSFFNPFSVSGCNKISVSSFYWIWVEMNATVTSSSLSVSTKAGRFLQSERKEKAD